MSLSSVSSLSNLVPQQVAAIFQLQQLGQAIAKNTLQLATQKRINSAADDPAGFVLASSLQLELSTLTATLSGLAQATSLVGTAASTAGQIVSQLTQAKSLAQAVAGGTLSAAQVAADQTQLDQILTAVDALAATSFNGTRLLDGSSSFQTSGVNTGQIPSVQVLNKQTSANVAVSVNVTSLATPAINSYSGGTLGAAATVNVTGPSGSAVVTLASGATTDAITTAFNSVSYLTGVTAAKVDGTTVNFKTVNYGSAAKVTIAATSGTFNTTTSGTVAGTDAQANINGQVVTGSGSVFTVTTNQTTLQIAVNPTVSGALQSFTVSGNGLLFVLGERPANSVQLGLPPLNTAALGGISGTLTSISSSGTNSLISGNATTALNIINNALTQATVGQASLASFQTYTLGAASSVATSTQQNVTSALNAVVGIDAATVSSQLANNQLLQQTTTAALQLFNTQRLNLVSILLGLPLKA